MWNRVLLLAVLSLLTAFKPTDKLSQSSYPEGIPPYLYVQARWVDSLLQSMTPDERIAQMFMVAAFASPDTGQGKVIDLIKNYGIGGLIFMKGTPVRQASLTNYFQALSKIPLLISQDAEWGLSMRLDSTIRFPREIMLGAIQNDTLIYEFGKEMARQCRRVGVNVSFSPVVDINNNPLNPVIGDRSFGEDKFNVSAKGIAYMRGLQDGGVLACAKHFPGHGDVDQDSHKTLPTVNASRQHLDSVELYPFRKMIAAGVGSIMVAHLSIPSIDTSVNLPSSLSKKVVTGLLKLEMGYKGLSITDALNMKGAGSYIHPGEIDLKALLAGNDILLYAGDVPDAIARIKEAITKGEVSQEDIDTRVRKILQAKYWLGLKDRLPIETNHLIADLNAGSAQFLKQQLTENALTLVRNKSNLIPIRKVDSLSFASLAIGDNEETPFQEMLSNYAGVTHFQITKDATGKEFDNIETRLKDFNIVFISVGNMSRYPANGFGVTENTKQFVAKLSAKTKVILTVFGSPYALRYFDSSQWLLEAYNEDDVSQELAAQLIFGSIPAKGKLPVNASPGILMGQGINSNTVERVKYSMPEELGMKTERLRSIDSLANEAIDSRATPGCQVWVAKDGKVIWDKSYGNFTYDANVGVQNKDLYDLASVTKIAATTMMIMKLYEEKKLDINKTVGDYLPEFKATDKGNIKIHELLTHEAGFAPYFPFYKETLDSIGRLKESVYSRMNHAPYSMMVTPDIFMNRSYVDSMWKRIIKTPLQTPGKYVYSDNDFYMLKRIAETISGVPLDQFVQKNFYTPLGLHEICFNPLARFSKDQIVPSNYDFFWRRELLQGTVHDQGAAMLGGVAGHAGLFSNANDLGVLMQMLLNHGRYAGKTYLDSATVARFSQRYSLNSRRGLGFDKAEPDKSKASPACKSASSATFGHQGFTGTCVWVDPEYNLVYIFLSNRTFPDDENKKLNTLDTRIKIQEAIYDAFLNSN